jgi:hypothetical protein
MHYESIVVSFNQETYNLLLSPLNKTSLSHDAKKGMSCHSIIDFKELGMAADIASG